MTNMIWLPLRIWSLMQDPAAAVFSVIRSRSLIGFVHCLCLSCDPTHFFYIAFLSMVTHVQKRWKTVSFGVASMTLLLVLLETPLASSKAAWLTWPTTSISPSLTANTECFSFVGFMSIFKAPSVLRHLVSVDLFTVGLLFVNLFVCFSLFIAAVQQ